MKTDKTVSGEIEALKNFLTSVYEKHSFGHGDQSWAVKYVDISFDCRTGSVFLVRLRGPYSDDQYFHCGDIHHDPSAKESVLRRAWEWLKNR